MGLVADFKADIHRSTGHPAAIWQLLVYPILHGGLRAILCYRLAHRVRSIPGLSATLKRFAMLTTGAEIHPRAEIGPGVHLPHPSGVIVGQTVKIHGQCTLFQQVTLGPRRDALDPDDGPTLKKNTFCYPGARVFGPVTIGERVQIGPNCVIFHDLADGSTVLPNKPMVLEGLTFAMREPKNSPENTPATDEIEVAR